MVITSSSEGEASRDEDGVTVLLRLADMSNGNEKRKNQKRQFQKHARSDEVPRRDDDLHEQ